MRDITVLEPTPGDLFIARRCLHIQRPTLKALETPDRPFLHDVNAGVTDPPSLERGPVIHANVFLMIARRRIRRPSRLVEPDGIEPTTSCLQSTRSTN